MFFISFQCFYKNLRGQDETKATWSIREHAKKTCKKMMNEEKGRLVRNMKEIGKSAKDLRPWYFQLSKRSEAVVFSTPSMGKSVEILG